MRSSDWTTNFYLSSSHTKAYLSTEKMSLEWIVGFLEASDCWTIMDHSEAIASRVAVLEPHLFFPRPLRYYLILWKGKELNDILSRVPQT